MIVLIPALLLLFQIISVRTEVVAVPVVVTDGDGHQVDGLSQDNFQIYEDGRLQPIAVFHHGHVPLTLGLIVDRSQSMRPKSAVLVTAVSALLQSGRTDDELFAVGFNDEVTFALAADRPFTNDARELGTKLTDIRAEGRTALYDGVTQALRHLERGHSEKRVLILVTDGGDNASREKYDSVLALARRSQAVIYAIGLLGTPPAEEEEDAGLIKRLCKDTGGVAYFPKSAQEVLDVSTRMARELREQYTLGFEPSTRVGPPVFRRIDVKVIAPGRGRLHVRTRAGYTPRP